MRLSGSGATSARRVSSHGSASRARSATPRWTTPSRRASAGGLDGGPNTDLNVGAIVALSPALDPATKAEFNAWGPGKYDPRHHAFDGTNLLPLNSPSPPTRIPPT